MSTYSDAWRAASNETRAAYNGFAQRYTYFTGPFWPPDYPYDQSYFFYGTHPALGYRGYDIFCHNLTAQIALTGSFDPDVILTKPEPTYSEPIDSPVFDASFLDGWGDQMFDPALWEYNYPRLKYRVRKNYTRGQRTARRNL